MMTAADWAKWGTQDWEAGKWKARDIQRFLNSLPQAPRESYPAKERQGHSTDGRHGRTEPRVIVRRAHMRAAWSTHLLAASAHGWAPRKDRTPGDCETGAQACCVFSPRVAGGGTLLGATEGPNLG